MYLKVVYLYPIVIPTETKWSGGIPLKINKGSLDYFGTPAESTRDDTDCVNSSKLPKLMCTRFFISFRMTCDFRQNLMF